MQSNKIRNIWKKYAPQYWWGDPLDVRFYLCKELSQLHNKKILDVGCNIGIILNSADDSNTKEGFDLDAEAIRIAKIINKDKGCNAKFFLKDVFKSDLKKNTFDVLILSNVLPSYDYGGYTEEDCSRFIARCSSYLKKEGILYLTTPNGNNLYYRKRHKIHYDALAALLTESYEFKIRVWNPFPIQAGHLLKFIPGWPHFLVLLMRLGFMKSSCVSFYVQGIKK